MTGSQNQQPIRLGIVGCGAVAQGCHLKALQNLPQYEVRYLCDRRPEMALEAKTMYGLGATVTTNVPDLANQVDAVILCVWPKLHLPITKELLSMGVDVLCEKPAATASDDIVAMADAAEQANRLVAIGHWCRFQKNAWILRKLLSLGYIGEVEEVVAEFGAPLTWPMTSGAYYDRNSTLGGVTYDAGVHVVDLVVWLFGGLDNIQYEDDSYGGVETNGVIRGTLNIDGRQVPCRIAVSWTHTLRNGVRVIGKKATAEALFTNREIVIVHQRVGGENLRLNVTADGIDMPFHSANPYEAQLEDFAHAVWSRQAPVTSVDSTVIPLRIIEQAYAVRTPMPQPWVEAGLEKK